MEDIIRIAMTSLISCLVGILMSMIPIKRMLDAKFLKASREAEKRKDFTSRRERISDEAIHGAMRVIFWLRKGCKIHDETAWNGELDKAVADFEKVETKLLELNSEMLDAFKSEHS